ncbi:MAG TPA: PEP-CTERM sorting domain-containing protein [Burkholderiales bacterium]|nr:PEP-CTERM sorting domain-containing protein [Burkholderiales bacterium]
MMRAIVAALSVFLATSLHAQPVTYSFSTGAILPFGTVFSPTGAPVVPADFANAGVLHGLLLGTSVSGSFQYDSSAPRFQTNVDGSVIYAANPNSSYLNLAGSVTGGATPGYTFSDPRGFTTVANETNTLPIPCPGCPVPPPGDGFHLIADSQSPSGTNRNISGFGVGDFRLYNVRMFWLEGQAVPEVVPDLVPNTDLPGAPPSVHGRLALDFIIGNDVSKQYALFYDSLAVAAPIPEPETYAMLLAGLALLGFQVRRKKKSPR